MVDVPESIQCLFTANLQQCEQSICIEVPANEVELGGLTPDETYRVALLAQLEHSTESSNEQQHQAETTHASEPQTPPVTEGEIKIVTVESTGDQGDGIAKVERGYVVIVPGSVPGDELAVEIHRVKENFAMAEIVDDSELTYE